MKGLILTILLFLSLTISSQTIQEKIKLDSLFMDAITQPWKVVMEDDCKTDWTKQWFKDGETSRIEHSSQGMSFYAGKFNEKVTETDDFSGHSVLWTKQSFEGDIMVEYDYTRLDTVNRFVTIIYLCAEGSGKKQYVKDIYQWRNLRKIPAMRLYFDHMQAYHISYSAYDVEGSDTDYIRARRYMPESKGLEGTDLDNEYGNSGFFQPGEKNRITVISRGNYIFMRVTSSTQSSVYYWDKTKFPLLSSGRVGLRMMYYRGAVFNNLKISTLP